MDKKKIHTDQINRRSLLKSTASASIGIAGVSQTAIATRGTTDDEFTWVQSLDKVQRILKELGHRRIPQEATAETKELSIGDIDAKLVSVDLSYGTLQVGTLNDNVDVAFMFDREYESPRRSERLDPSSGSEPRPPETYRDIPESSDAWLLASESDTTFLRTATEDERKTVLSTLPVPDRDDILVYTTSASDGFNVDVLDPETLAPSTTEEIDDKLTQSAGNSTEPIRYKVTSTQSGALTASTPVTEYSVQAANLEPQFIGGISKPAKEIAETAAKEVGWQGIDAVTDTCGDEMLACATGIIGQIPGCLRCAPACTAGMGISGGALCFLCVFGVCSWMLTGASCLSAVDCVEG